MGGAPGARVDQAQRAATDGPEDRGHGIEGIPQPVSVVVEDGVLRVGHGRHDRCTAWEVLELAEVEDPLLLVVQGGDEEPQVADPERYSVTLSLTIHPPVVE